MNPQLISLAFKAEADALPEVAAQMKRYTGQDTATHEPPSLTLHTEVDKLYAGRSGFFRVLLIVQSMQNNGGDHGARVELVRQSFVAAKADRIAAINGRGAVVLKDYGLTATKAEQVTADGANRFRTTFTLKVAASLPPAV